MISFDNVYNKGEKVIVITDNKGYFEICEVEIKGTVFKDYVSADGKIENEILYVFYIDNSTRFAQAKDLHKTTAAAIEFAEGLVGPYSQQYDNEIVNIGTTIADLKTAKQKMLDSYKALSTFVAADGSYGRPVGEETVPAGDVEVMAEVAGSPIPTEELARDVEDVNVIEPIGEYDKDESAGEEPKEEDKTTEPTN